MLKDSAKWICKPTANDVALFARDVILKEAQQAIKERGKFKIVLAGGTTPERVYSLLAQEACDWRNWHLYLGDERCLPADHSERNSQVVQKKLLIHAKIPKENVHFIPAEQGSKRAARSYEKVVNAALPFDMVLLGMGEDGHTASLFPEQSHDPNELVHAVFDAPKPPAERVSLSVGSLSQSQCLLIIITGSTKHDSVISWRKGKNLPITQIGTLGKAVILLDSSAWSR